MAVNLEITHALEAELRQVLQKYDVPADEIERLIAKFQPDIEEAIALAEFAEAFRDTTGGAIMIDPLAHLTDEQRERHLAERIREMDADTRKMLERTQGKWANDNP